MIPELALSPTPEWLLQLDATSMRSQPFPLHDVLRTSAYYPASHLDGSPIVMLAGHLFSFVYVDYLVDEATVCHELFGPGRGFKGYREVGRRSVSAAELAPNGWPPLRLREGDGRPGPPSRRRDIKPFGLWTVMERKAEMPPTHGPARFSFLFLCTEGVSAYQALYISNGIVPTLVAVIQPGHAMGGNWTNFEDPEQIFARVVMSHPGGLPPLLLHGGHLAREHYEQACWPPWSTLIGQQHVTPTSRRRLWRLPHLPTMAGAAHP